MNVASLELCKELYELSGWSDTDWINQLQFNDDKPSRKRIVVLRETDACDSHDHKPYPAYDLGYLLRKLPETYEDDDLGLAIDLYPHNRGKWECGYEQLFTNADTPEDAACKLAIELFKQGILTKENA